MPVFLLYHFLVKKSIKVNEIKGKISVVKKNILIAHILKNREYNRSKEKMLKNCFLNCINRRKIRELKSKYKNYEKNYQNFSKKVEKYEEMKKIQLKIESDLLYKIYNMTKNTMEYNKELIEQEKEEEIIIQYTAEKYGNKLQELESLKESHIKRNKNFIEKLKKYEEMEKIQLKTESNLKYAIDNMAKNNENTMTYIEKLIRNGKEEGNEEKVVIQYTEREEKYIECKVFYNNKDEIPTLMQIDGKILKLKDFCFNHENRNKGIGSAVMRSLTKYLKNKNIVVIEGTISSIDKKDKLINFYKNVNGFEIGEETKIGIKIYKRIN
jgi:hypothetical protein